MVPMNTTTAAANAALDRLDVVSVADLTDDELSAVMSPEFDWEMSETNEFVMIKIQTEFNTRNLTTN